MAENIEMIRPINLPEAQQLSENDVFILDSETGGVRKIPKNKVYTPVDDTLSESGEAADAKVTGEKIDELKAETGLIQNPVGNKSGELVSFSDGADMPAKSVIVNIEPQQSGSGTPSPSNVRQISGWESVNVYDTGVNVWDEEWEVGAIGSGTGAPILSNNCIRSKNYNNILPSTTYYTHCGSANSKWWVNIAFYDANYNYISNAEWCSNQTFTTPSNAAYFKMWTNGETSYGTTYNNDISINYPSTDTDYHAYNPNSSTTTVNLGRTVYGGTLDVVSGVLTDKMGIVDLGSLSWAFIAPNSAFPYGYFYANISGKKVGETNIIADSYKTYASMQGNIDNGIMGSASNNRIFIVNSAYSDANAFKTAMSGKYVCYELATPQTYQLTPTEIQTLLGDNNVWADSGDVEITYRRDINIVIDELTNAIVSLGSNV